MKKRKIKDMLVNLFQAILIMGLLTGIFPTLVLALIYKIFGL